MCVFVARHGSSSAPSCPKGPPLPAHPPQGAIRAGQAEARGWPLPYPLEHQPPPPPHPHSGPAQPGGHGAGVLGRGWVRSLPGPLLTAATPAAASSRLPAPRACACGSSPLSSRPGQSCWRAGADLSPACGTCGPPCRTVRCGPAMTAFPCVAAACPSREVQRWGRLEGIGVGGSLSHL